MNRGSVYRQRLLAMRCLRFNEAPIHESGKYHEIELRSQTPGALQ